MMGLVQSGGEHRISDHRRVFLCTGIILLAGFPAWGLAGDTPNPNPATSKEAHPAVEIIPLAKPEKSALSSRKKSYSFTVGGGDWMNTGVPVMPGDRLDFQATGNIVLADGTTASAAGAARGWRDLLRIYPLNTANSGELIGRIGSDTAAVPFAIGATKTVDVESSGNLFLRANLSPELTATGNFSVKMKLSQNKEQKSGEAVDLKNILSPATFDNIPRRVHDLQGNPGDMVNFAILGTEAQVKAAFAAAGWIPVDRTTEDAVLHGLLATLSRGSYTAMPMSTLYLFGRPQDLSYARAEPLKVAFTRHHLRVWKAPEQVGGKQLWVGSATHDNGLEKDQRNGGVTHRIDPDIDQERDFIEQSFASAGVLAGAAYVLPSNPVSSSKTATGGSFHTDGRIVVLDLK